MNVIERKEHDKKKKEHLNIKRKKEIQQGLGRSILLDHIPSIATSTKRKKVNLSNQIQSFCSETNIFSLVFCCCNQTSSSSSGSSKHVIFILKMLKKLIRISARSSSDVVKINERERKRLAFISPSFPLFSFFLPLSPSNIFLSHFLR